MAWCKAKEKAKAEAKAKEEAKAEAKAKAKAKEEAKAKDFLKFQYKKIKNSLYIKRPIIFAPEIT